MESIVRNVRDIGADERRHLEHVLGQKLRDNQQLIIQVISLSELRAEDGDAARAATREAGAESVALPAWCNVYGGLSDHEIADVEKVVLTRAALTRTSE